MAEVNEGKGKCMGNELWEAVRFPTHAHVSAYVLFGDLLQASCDIRGQNGKIFERQPELSSFCLLSAEILFAFLLIQ